MPIRFSKKQKHGVFSPFKAFKSYPPKFSIIPTFFFLTTDQNSRCIKNTYHSQDNKSEPKSTKIEVQGEKLPGFSGFPSFHLETLKWTFSRVRASDLYGSFRQFLTMFAQMFEYVMYVMPADLQNGTATLDAISHLSSCCYFFFLLSGKCQGPSPILVEKRYQGRSGLQIGRVKGN